MLFALCVVRGFKARLFQGSSSKVDSEAGTKMHQASSPATTKPNPSRGARLLLGNYGLVLGAWSPPAQHSPTPGPQGCVDCSQLAPSLCQEPFSFILKTPSVLKGK